MPTNKQLLASKKMVENGGNASQAMIDAGYSPATAKTPQKLTDSKGYQSITEELTAELGHIKVTPKKLAKVIKQGLNAKQPGKVVIIEKSPDGTEVNKKTVEVPDHTVRHKYLDTTLKVMGAYPKEDNSPASLIIAKFKQVAGQYVDVVEGEVIHAEN